MLEWLSSPIIYDQDEEAIRHLQALVPHCYSITNLRYHYLRMAQINTEKCLRKEQVIHKKYFYSLRPLLALRWLERNHKPVPMTFQCLRDQADLDPTLNRAIDELLVRKQAGRETDADAPNPVISAFIDTELARHEHAGIKRRGPLPDIVPLNLYFRWLIQRSQAGD